MGEWYCGIAGREIGPLSSEQLKAMADRGQILPTDYVRQGPAGRWVAASCVRGLFADHEEPAPTPPPGFSPPAQAQTQYPATAEEPNVAWPSEPLLPEPFVSQPPVSSRAAEVFRDSEDDADEAVPFEVFAESSRDPSVSAASRSLILMARARRKRQQQVLIVVLSFFALLGLGVAATFLAISDVKDAVKVEQPGGLSGLSKKLKKAATEKTSEQESDAAPVFAPKKTVSPPTPSAKNKPAKPAPIKTPDAPDLIDRSMMQTIVGDVPVRIVSVVYDARASSPRLLITVDVNNPDGQENLDFAAWSLESDGRGATLFDDQGNRCEAKQIDAASVLGKPIPFSIGPKESVRDVLAFEPPPSGAKHLQLELSGAAFGRLALAEFQIPIEAVAGMPSGKSKEAGSISQPATDSRQIDDIENQDHHSFKEDPSNE